MNPQKAIEILELNLREAGKSMPPECYQAIVLGIEALDLILSFRAKGWSRPTDPLPSETKEG